MNPGLSSITPPGFLRVADYRCCFAVARSNLTIKQKIVFKTYFHLLKYFGAQASKDPRTKAPVVHLSYRAVLMALFCFFVFLYIMILQVTILARNIEASYMDASVSSSEPKFQTTKFTQSPISRTKYEASFATAFRTATTSSTTTRLPNSKRLFATQTLSMVRVVRSPGITSTTASTISSNLAHSLASRATVTPAVAQSHLTRRKAYKTKAPAEDLSALCLYHDGSSLAKRWV